MLCLYKVYSINTKIGFPAEFRDTGSDPVLSGADETISPEGGRDFKAREARRKIFSAPPWAPPEKHTAGGQGGGQRKLQFPYKF